MGLSMTLIGLLPGYATAGVLAPWLLRRLRFGQGVGVGGEWGGAALLATENAPHGRRAWFGMFPQLGPPIGFLMANCLVLVAAGASRASSPGHGVFRSCSAPRWWRSASTSASPSPRRPPSAPWSKRASARRSPVGPGFRDHRRPSIQGSLAIVVCYALFYVSTVFALGYGVDDAAHWAHRLPGDAVRGGAVHGGGDADFRRPRRPLRPAAGAARRLDRSPRRSGSPCRPCSTAERSACWRSCRSRWRRWASPSRRSARCCRSSFPPACATPARRAPTTCAVFRRLRCARTIAQLLLARGGIAWVGDYIVAAAAVSFASLLSVRVMRDAPQT